MKPKVAIVDGSFANSVVQTFLNFGFEPVTTLTAADALVLTGGADISPSLYGQDKLVGMHFGHEDRDRAELKIYDIIGSKPKIGICRGGQFLNAMNGGSMWQDVNYHNGAAHRVYNRRSRAIWEVTSIHHQMMIPGVKGELILTAGRSTRLQSPGSIIEQTPDTNPDKWTDAELIWYPDDKAFCYQAHPEQGRLTEQLMFFTLLRDCTGLQGTPEQGRYSLDGVAEQKKEDAEYTEHDNFC